ncbi:periplasmic heavy metal sensor, partial [Cribrihabitans sp. XS_ASV171]
MAEVTRKSPLWMRLLLGVSLAVNLAVAGLAVGAVLRHGGPERDRGPRSLGVALYRALPDEDRQALRDAGRARYQERREAGAADLDAMLVALRSEPFDAEAVAVLLRGQVERTRSLHLGLQDRLVARV